MTDDRGQSEKWYDEGKTLSADALGPFNLVATGDFVLDEDGYAVVAGKARVMLKNTETGEFLIDEEVDPVDPVQGFTKLDQQVWQRRASLALIGAGYNLDELAAADNAA
jgi:hypothetical protein